MIKRSLVLTAILWAVVLFCGPTVASLFRFADFSPSVAYAGAPPYSVFVGYADDLRASPMNFPTPWVGAPGVTFLGCSPTANCTYDTSAVRIVNNSAAPITVNAVAIHVDTCTYALWSSSLPVTLSPGGQLILAQTVSGATNGCSNDGHMDTSDVGPGGEPYSGNCTPDGIIPTVDVTVDSVTTTYSDTGQVINTRGVDAYSCNPPPGPDNESIPWTSIGSPPCTPGALALAPLSQSHFEGGTATLTATLTCGAGSPLSGAPVDLAILSGPNTGLPFSAGMTDANGNVSFTYTDPADNVGTDTLQVSVPNLAGSFASNTATATWVDLPLDCSQASPSPAMLWPPNHKFVPVTISGVVDPESLPITTTITGIRQDEPTQAPGTGHTCPDATGIGTSTAQLRAERDGHGDGRVYHVAFSAVDTEGASCTGEVTVCVPHDQHKPVGCVDQGPIYDSTVCAP